jgi:HK97 family phage prohead protease
VIERMSFGGDVELRMDPDYGPTITGLGVRYNVYSADLGGFVEVALPASGAKTIQEQDIRALFNHDPSLLLGRKMANTLRMVQEPEGVRYFISAPNTQVGRDVVELIGRRDLFGSSFGFNLPTPRAATWTKTARGYPVRQLHEFVMRDIGPVTFPAYGGTEPALRQLAEERSLPYDRVKQAAQAGSLGSLLEPDEEDGTRPRPEPHRPRRHFVTRR